jgi:HAE1 family hydrophobic/amphiphilic exporter-1
MVFLVVFIIAAGFFGTRLPNGFLPTEDQGYVFLNLQLPLASSLQRTNEVAKKVEAILLETPGIQHVTTVVGFSLLSSVTTTYNGFFFVTLNPWDERTTPEEKLPAIFKNVNQKLAELPEAMAFLFPPPAIPGVGTSGGVSFVLEDRSGQDVAFLAENLERFMEAARQRPEVASMNTTFIPAVPQVFAKVDRDKALKQGVKLEDVYKTLQTFMGGVMVNYFNRFGRVWQVYVQAEGDFRTRAENVGQFYVRNKSDEMVPLSTLVTMEKSSGPEFTMRFNGYRSAQIFASGKPGYTSGQVMQALEDVFTETMPREMGFDYMGMSFQEKAAAEGVPASVIFGFSLLFVFLILAAQYESWGLPFSVLLCTPIAVFGAFGALWALGMENNVFTQIGLIMLIGLSAKNAILIVEFAKMEYEKGRSLVEAALTGARLRLRPILMTSLAFILGVVPLVLSSGSGAHGRILLGVAVIGGMIAASFIAIFLIPVAFYVVERLMHRHDESLPPGPAGPESDDSEFLEDEDSLEMTSQRKTGPAQIHLQGEH